jgi:hypothetical protein
MRSVLRAYYNFLAQHWTVKLMFVVFFAFFSPYVIFKIFWGHKGGFPPSLPLCINWRLLSIYAACMRCNNGGGGELNLCNLEILGDANHCVHCRMVLWLLWCCFFPQAVLVYFVSNSMFSLVQILLFKQHPVKKFFGIPIITTARS